MTTQKVTLSLNSETYKKFQEIKTLQGLSISSWVTMKMQEEIEKNHHVKVKESAKIIANLLRQDYSNLTGNMSDERILNDIVTFLLAKKIIPEMYHKLHRKLDNIK